MTPRDELAEALLRLQSAPRMWTFTGPWAFADALLALPADQRARIAAALLDVETLMAAVDGVAGHVEGEAEAILAALRGSE